MSDLTRRGLFRRLGTAAVAAPAAGVSAILPVKVGAEPVTVEEWGTAMSQPVARYMLVSASGSDAMSFGCSVSAISASSGLRGVAWDDDE